MHTPGPWSVDFHDFAVFCDTGAEVAAITPGNHDDGTAITLEEMDANAHLIAAAPSLLAALISATDELSGLSGCKGTDDIVRAARAAIELATGDKYAER